MSPFSPTLVLLVIVVHVLLCGLNLSWAVWEALCLVAIVVFETQRPSDASGHRARDRASLGASTIPKVRGRLPGNIDILWRLVALEHTEYCAETLRQWEKEYGPTFDMGILWSHQIVTSDPVNIHEILSTRFTSFEKSKKFHDMLESFLGDSIFTTDGDAWRYHRALARPFFAHERTSDLDLFERHTGKVLQILSDKISRGDAIDVQDLFARFTMDTITEMLFGNCVNSLESESSCDNYSEFISAYNTLQKIAVQRVRIGSNWRLFELWSGDRTKEPVRIIDEFVRPIVQKAVDKQGSMSNATSGGTFLDYLVQKNPDPTLMRDSLMSFLVAGRDTTASLLTFAVYALTLHPEVLTTLHDEIKEVVGAQNPPTLNGIKRMKYLRAVLNETLRLFPPVPMNIRRAVEPTILTSPLSNLGPLFMQGGVSVSYIFLLMHRRKDIWGADAEEFRPERWLADDAGDKDKSLEHAIRFTPFNAGPRTCLGQTFAYQECSYLLIRLLQHFDSFSFAPDAQPADSLPPVEWRSMEGRQAVEEVRVKSSLTLYVEGGLWLRLGSRRGVANESRKEEKNNLGDRYNATQ